MRGLCDVKCADIEPQGVVTVFGIIGVIIVWVILNKSAGGLYECLDVGLGYAQVGPPLSQPHHDRPRPGHICPMTGLTAAPCRIWTLSRLCPPFLLSMTRSAQSTGGPMFPAFIREIAQEKYPVFLP